MIRLEECVGEHVGKRVGERVGERVGGGGFADVAAAVAAAVDDDVLVDATRMFFLFTRPIRFVEQVMIVLLKERKM